MTTRLTVSTEDLETLLAALRTFQGVLVTTGGPGVRKVARLITRLERARNQHNGDGG